MGWLGKAATAVGLGAGCATAIAPVFASADRGGPIAGDGAATIG
jgi:hypothetical protein